MKLDDCQKWLQEHNVDVLFLFHQSEYVRDEMLNYLVDFKVTHGWLAVPAKGKPVLFISGFEADSMMLNDKVQLVKTNDPVRAIKNKWRHVQQWGINARFAPVHVVDMLKKVFSNKYIDCSHMLIQLRMTKTSEEQKRVRKACLITSSIIEQCMQNFHKFKTEMDVVRFLSDNTLKHECTFSFQPIVASGANASIPHHHSCNKPISRGFCIIDFGVRWKGYCSDMTRTVFVGAPTTKERILYEKMLAAQENALQAVKPGVSLEYPERIARKSLGALAKYFIHGIGHSIGRDVHDIIPSISRKDQLFKEQMIYAIEPGLYVPKKFGIRIEDDILVTKKGIKVLTSAPKNLYIIK